MPDSSQHASQPSSQPASQPALQPSSQSTSQPNAPWSGAATYVPGLPRLAVSSHGAGELLLFLHGIGGNRSNWHRQLARFGQRFHAVSWDARGYGQSDDYAGDVTISDFADDVLRVINHFEAERVHLVGLSLGGRIAQRFAMRYPERVATLALVDTRPDTRDTRSPAEREAFLAARAKPLLAGKTPADIAPAVARGLAGPNVAPAALQELVDSISALHPESYLKAIKANLDDDFVGNLGAIEVPTLVVVGEFDTLTPLPLSEELVREIPGAQLRVVSNSGHLTNIENPVEFDGYLEAFLAQHA